MKRWQVGRVRVTQVIELGPTPTSPRFFFKDPPPDLVARHGWLKPHFANDDGKLLASIHCFVIESAGRRIVVDTCVGNDKTRSSPAWNALQRAVPAAPHRGRLRRRVDRHRAVHAPARRPCRLEHAPGRRAAGCRRSRTRAICSRRKEWEHWSQQTACARPRPTAATTTVPTRRRCARRLGAADHRRRPGRAGRHRPPAHRRGMARADAGPHAGPRQRAHRVGGERAVITGDLMHHPLQCAEPDRIGNFDDDPRGARHAARTFWPLRRRDRTLVFGTHFAPPTGGHVVAAGDSWRFEVQ